MKITLSRNDLFTEDTCVICGEEFPPDIITATAYTDDKSRSYGVVCPKCIHGGIDGIRQAIAGQVDTLRERAERLLAVAAELEAEATRPLDVPTWNKWRLTHLKTFLRHINMLDDAHVAEFRHNVKAWRDNELQEYLIRYDAAPNGDDSLLQAKYAIAWHERESRNELGE
jgi:hypothetical protein